MLGTDAIDALQLNYVNKSIYVVQNDDSEVFEVLVEKTGFTLPVRSTPRLVTFRLPRENTEYVLESTKEGLLPIVAIVRLNEDSEVVFPILNASGNNLKVTPGEGVGQLKLL